MKTKSYRIEGGNSSQGQIGFVAYIKAKGKTAALKAFKDAIGTDENRITLHDDKGNPIGEVLVYFNPDKTAVKDVEADNESQ